MNPFEGSDESDDVDPYDVQGTNVAPGDVDMTRLIKCAQDETLRQKGGQRKWKLICAAYNQGLPKGEGKVRRKLREAFTKWERSKKGREEWDAFLKSSNELPARAKKPLKRVREKGNNRIEPTLDIIARAVKYSLAANGMATATKEEIEALVHDIDKRLNSEEQSEGGASMSQFASIRYRVCVADGDHPLPGDVVALMVTPDRSLRVCIEPNDQHRVVCWAVVSAQPNFLKPGEMRSREEVDDELEYVDIVYSGITAIRSSSALTQGQSILYRGSLIGIALEDSVEGLCRCFAWMSAEDGYPLKIGALCDALMEID